MMAISVTSLNLELTDRNLCDFVVSQICFLFKSVIV